MVLSEQIQRTYAALDDAALLTVLQVLRDDMHRHMEQVRTLSTMHRESAGPDAQMPSTFEELFEAQFEALRASGDEPNRQNLDSVLDHLRTLTDGTGPLADPAAFEWFNLGYGRELAEREYFVRTELARRNLIPSLERPPEP